MAQPFPTSTASWLRVLLLGMVPLLLLVCGLRSVPSELGERTGQHQVFPVPKFRTVVLILDSVGAPMMSDATLMPFVSSLASSSLSGRSESCPGKATFPCVKSIFEGRNATTGTALQDFSAVASGRTTWPSSLAELGLRLVLTSDHTLNRLYPDAFVDSMNYETLKAPLLERDGYAFRAAARWMSDPSIDVLLLHIIGTDKVAHEYPVGGEIYRAKYLEADNFVRDVAGRLSAQDYLYVISDHGHNETGGHTTDSAYIAHGPLFPQGRHEDLSAPDMLFLLSVPYALTLPDQYEGSVRTDLTLMPNETRAKLLEEQARLWRLPAAQESTAQLEARLNAHVIENRQNGQREQGMMMSTRLCPWLLAGALFLLSQFGRKNSGRNAADRGRLLGPIATGVGVAMGLCGIAAGAWLVAIGAFLLCVRRFGIQRALGALALLAALGAAGFWLTPAGLRWFHLRGQSLGWSVFYPTALIAGGVVSLFLGAPSGRMHAVRVLWVVGLALWLFAYFGPYNFALAGRGPKIVLAILVPLAIALTAGFRSFFSLAGLCLLGLIPLINFHTESFNIEYKLMDQISELPMLGEVALGAVAGLLWVCSWRLGEIRMRGGWIRDIAVVAAWLCIARILFAEEQGKLIGCITAGIWLAGAIALLRRAKLPQSWSALAGAVVLFATFHFVLDGFAFSHVDFRFAAHKIIPFQAEAFRAPQLIAWVLVKYLFVLLPVLAVLWKQLAPEAVLDLLQLGWWRELMVGLSALGLAIYDPRGVNELCSEEVYFWTFLNIAVWLVCLASVWMNPRKRSLATNAESDVRAEPLAFAQ